MALPSLTLGAAGVEHSDRMQNQTDFLFPFLHFKCKNKQKVLLYNYPIKRSDSEITEFEKENRVSYTKISFNSH